jgi:hypothetical protein
VGGEKIFFLKVKQKFPSFTKDRQIIAQQVNI